MNQKVNETELSESESQPVLQTWTPPSFERVSLNEAASSAFNHSSVVDGAFHYS